MEHPGVTCGPSAEPWPWSTVPRSRSWSAEAPLEALISSYLASRKARFPAERPTSGSPLFVDRHGERLQRGGAQYLVADGASASEIQHLLGHESLATSQLYIDSTANEQRAAARANRTYRVLEKITRTTGPDRGSARRGLI